MHDRTEAVRLLRDPQRAPVINGTHVGAARPVVFLFCGQRAITNQAATRYLARNHERLHRKHGNNSFVLLLKVVNSQAYGPDVVELVADVTRAAQTPLPAQAVATRASHRAS